MTRRIVICAAAGSAAGSEAEAQAPTPLQITRSGVQVARRPPAENFDGAVQVAPLATALEPGRPSVTSVTFPPGARTAWHAHPLGQTLLVTQGTGWVQGDGGPFEVVREGDVVWFPPRLKHWHGATASTSMVHVAITSSLNGSNVTWMEKVSDQQYGP